MTDVVPDPPGTRPLTGWRVLVPHGGEWGERVSALLAEQGATSTVVPLIEFTAPDDVTPLDDAVRRLAQGAYTWLVVTSGTAVLALGSRAATLLGGRPDHALVAAIGATRVAAVGPGTARALERSGVEVHLLPQGERSARGLVAEFPATSDEADAVLYPRSDLADGTVADGLAALGWRVDAPVAYRTVTGALDGTQPGALSGTELREDVRAGVFHAILLSSGSTVRSTLEVVGTPPPPTVIACIGPRTERAARDAGLPVHVLSRVASAEGLVDALAEYAERQEPR